jgi:predicted DNA-binding transcriptional regulator AlpA
MPTHTQPDAQSAAATPSLWVLPEVLKRVPVSRSTWLIGVKEGRFPQPVHLSIRRRAWRPSEVEAALAAL